MSGFVTAVILAAGCGSRMQSTLTKQRMSICGKSILWHSVNAFDRCDEIDAIVVVCREDEVDWAAEQTANFGKISSIVIGGSTRAESAKIGFAAIPVSSEFVAFHDAARCLINSYAISEVVRSAYKSNAATAATAICDTLKLCDNGTIIKTVSRDGMYLAQTPQVFSVDLYEKGLEKQCRLDSSVTDDNMLIEMIGGTVSIVDTGRENIKITTPSDLEYASFLLGRREMNDFRIGHGYDVHKLTEGRRLILGGVNIPFDKGLLGHSDADVLVHAVMDSLLGAAGLGDIGRHFPDTSDEFKGISSITLLNRVSNLIKECGYQVGNIDVTLVMQKPKVSPYIEEMRSNIAEALGIDQGRVNIKATTEEHLGFTGSGEGAACHAVSILKK